MIETQRGLAECFSHAGSLPWIQWRISWVWLRGWLRDVFSTLCIKAGFYLRGFLRSYRSPLTRWNQVWRSRCIGKIRSEESRHLRSITPVNRVHLTGIKLDGRVPQWRKPGDTTCWFTTSYPWSCGNWGYEWCDMSVVSCISCRMFLSAHDGLSASDWQFFLLSLAQRGSLCPSSSGSGAWLVSKKENSPARSSAHRVWLDTSTKNPYLRLLF